jgi:GNAT superfamily N-acetyltransferase
LIDGLTPDLPETANFDAAKSILIMRFLTDDGSRPAYLAEIRKRVKPGVTYLHVDVTFGDRAEFDAVASAMREQTGLVGFAEIAHTPSTAIAKMVFYQPTSSVISEARARGLFASTGFRVVAPFYRGFWYAGWWLEAVYARGTDCICHQLIKRSADAD